MAIDKVKYWKNLQTMTSKPLRLCTTVEDGYMLALCAIWL